MQISLLSRIRTVAQETVKQAAWQSAEVGVVVADNLLANVALTSVAGLMPGIGAGLLAGDATRRALDRLAGVESRFIADEEGEPSHFYLPSALIGLSVGLPVAIGVTVVTFMAVVPPVIAVQTLLGIRNDIRESRLHKAPSATSGGSVSST
jgi:hypothetical protein